MKTLLTTLLLSAALLPALAVQHTISVSDFQYSPAQLSINLGDTVIFQRVSGSHPTQSTNGAFPTFNMDATHPVHMLMFSSVGTYPYFCIPHQAMGMVGSITVNQVTSAPAFVKATEVSVYPNPATDQITISHNMADVDAVKITNMIGQQVRFIRTGLNSNGQLMVNIADLPKGMYLVNLQSRGTTVFTRRVIKSR